MTVAATKTIAENRNELLAELAADNAGQVVFIRNDVFAKIKSYIARVAESEEIDLVEMDDHSHRVMKRKQYVFSGPVHENYRAGDREGGVVRIGDIEEKLNRSVIKISVVEGLFQIELGRGSGFMIRRQHEPRDPVLARIWVNQVEVIRQHGWDVFHEGQCCRCGRTLTTPESVESGIGPECRRQAGW